MTEEDVLNKICMNAITDIVDVTPNIRNVYTISLQTHKYYCIVEMVNIYKIVGLNLAYGCLSVHNVLYSL